MADKRYDFIHRNRTRLAADVTAHNGTPLPKGALVTLGHDHGGLTTIYRGGQVFHADTKDVQVERRVGEKYIILERGEGPSDECGEPAVFKNFEDAGHALAIWARTAPKGGGYDKTDFIVVWNDGETYEGRVDLKREHVLGYDLRAHIRSAWTFCAGLAKPAHLTQERYDKFLRQQEQENPDTKTGATEALARYDI